MSMSHRHWWLLAAAPALAISPLLVWVPPAAAASAAVVISEVYGGGGNSGATLTNDYVELYNSAEQAVDVSGWRVAYFSAGGSAGGTAVLTGSIAPKHSYLVQMAAGTGGTDPLPTPDATGTVAMSASSGRVDLLDGAGTPALVDRVAYGSGLPAEGTAAAPALSNTTSASRAAPCLDTDDNAADFRVTAPSPTNSATAEPSCSVPPPPPADPSTVAAIQGAAHLSALDGDPVTGVSGVVIAVGRTGFWMQSDQPDADVATSEGLFVFTATAPTVAVGDAVLVDGTVSEFRPGGSAGDNLTTTELVGPVVTVVSSGNPLPAPVVVGVDRVAPQQTIESGDPGTVEDPTVPFRPDTDAIDFDESLEGMRVALRAAEVVGPTSSFGEIPVVPGQGVAAVRSPRGGVVYAGYDRPNAMRLHLDDLLLPPGAMPTANVGDRLNGDVVGTMDYSFGNYKVLVSAPPAMLPGGITREQTARARVGEIAVATFNVENLALTDDPAKFDRLATQVVTHLRSPDLLALEEIQDDSGATNDATVDSTGTVGALTAAITAAGGPAYQARWVNPQDGADGGQPGGNIRQVFLYRTDRGLAFVDTPGGSATTATTVVGSGPRTRLSVSPGRINPTSAAWASSRKPLVVELTYRGQHLFAIANHFASKGGDDPLFGRWQQPVRASEVQRHQQANEVRAFVDQLQASDPLAKVVVLGDINDFEFSRTTDILVGGSGRAALLDLPRTLPADKRYTYVFEGNSQVLDHILISQSLAFFDPDRGGPRPRQRAFAYDIVHTNAEFADQDSDHDPQVVRLTVTPR